MKQKAQKLEEGAYMFSTVDGKKALEFGQKIAIPIVVNSTMLHRAERGDLNAVIVRQT